MKHTHVCTRWSAWIAVLLLIATLLTACRGDTPPTDTQPDTGDTQPTSPRPEETTAPENPTTAPETDPPAPSPSYLYITDAEGQTEYAVVVSAYAAAWETTAAAELASLLGCPLVEDTATAPRAHEILVGYTNRRNDIGVSFEELGEEGYFVMVKDQKLAIGANSAAGMTQAVTLLKDQLVHTDAGWAVTDTLHTLKTASPQIPESPVLSGAYADTIRLAAQLRNGVQMGFTDDMRTKYTMSNAHMTLQHDLSTAGQKQVAALTNAHGIPYILHTMDPYITNTNGDIFFSKDSSANGRLNIYEFGYYYYNAHILDQNFGMGYLPDTSGEGIADVLSQERSMSANQVTTPRRDKEGIFSFTVQGTADPYVIFNRVYNYKTKDYNAVQITLRCQKATNAEIYFVAGNSNSFNGEQHINFSVTPGEEFRTYYVPLDKAAGYTGTIRQFRLDIGGAVGELIEIKEFKLVKLIPTDIPSVKLDRAYHVYSDKLHTSVRVVAENSVDRLASLGMITKVDAARVQKLIVKDAHGLHDTLEGVDWASAEYVGFDIDRAGIFGYILLDHATSGQLTVTCESTADGHTFYVLNQCYTLPQGQHLDTYQDIQMGQRIYTDETHSFTDFLKIAEEERHPLTQLTIHTPQDGAHVVGYDALRGAYRLDVNGTDFNFAYYQEPNKYYCVDAAITGADDDRHIYLYTHTAHGSLESGVLLDGNNTLLPVAVEVCKNFAGENEEPLYDHGDRSYGEIFFPLSVKAHTTVRVQVLNLYQNWGQFPLKQLSSIQFIAPYYHLSCGVTETNCIAPYYVYGKDFWTLPDFRSMSAPLWAGQPQHTSVGRLYFLQYVNQNGQTIGTESTWAKIDAAGPTYADISMGYRSDDGRIQVNYRHAEMPHTDENRTYYTIELNVLEDISFEDFKRDFSLFSFDGRSVLFQSLGYLDQHNQPQIVETARGSQVYYYSLGMEHPYVDYFSCPSSNDYVNFALLLKDWDITIGGNPYTGCFLLRDAYEGGLNRASLTLDLGEVTLKAGDRMLIHMILLPWGSQLSTDDQAVRAVRQDACIAPYSVTATIGTVLQDEWIPKIKAEKNTAHFTLSNGKNNAVVRVYGLTDYEHISIYTYEDGGWISYDPSAFGYDAYTLFYDADGTYSVSFVVPMDGTARDFQVEAK